jgi:hypothetical protein
VEILQDFKTPRFWRHFLIRAFACFGAISTVLQTSNVLFPTFTGVQGLRSLVIVLAVALVGGLIWSWPRPITHEYSAPKTKISILKGNILEEKAHLVIGTNDTFDTETPNIISQSSLQGQVLQRFYGGDVKNLDAELAKDLASKSITGTIIKEGKQHRYGIGAISTVKQAGRLIFFSAYCEMDGRNNSASSPDSVWLSLRLLWEEVSRKGNGGTVSVPVIGGGLARLSSLLPAQDAIRLTLLSFMFASRKSKICDELRIIVRPDDYKKLDRLELQSFLSSLRDS